MAMTKQEMFEAASRLEEQFEAPELRYNFQDSSRKAGIHKAGVIPYHMNENGQISFYLMKPTGAHPELGEPAFQIAKGTREIFMDGEWQNYYPNPKTAKIARAHPERIESLFVNAMREGIEEIGLKPENVLSVQDAGRVDYTSESSGKPKSMWCFLAQVQDQNDFMEPDKEHADTGVCQWFTLEDENLAEVRADHLKILQLLSPVLQTYIQNNNII